MSETDDLQKTSQMKPCKELLEIARAKASNLSPRTQIRLTAEEKSYYLFSDADGTKYIGWEAKEPMPKFFKNRPVYQFVKNETNEVIASVQKLF